MPRSLRSYALMPALFLVALAADPGRRSAGGADDALPTVTINDNRVPAGRMADGRLWVDLEVRRARWFVRGPEHPAGEVLAFAERGRAPAIPGPLLRVPLGTTVTVSVTNPLDTALVVHGLAARRVAAMDSLVVPAGATREVEFPADVEGTYYYWAGLAGQAFEGRTYDDSQLHGAFVVDPADPAERREDRILVLGRWVQAKDAQGEPDVWTEFFVINGYPWPLTERFTYDMGDSVRWRIVNTTDDVHPLHLHGFYYRVESRGDLARDTVYWPSEQRMAVTERMAPGTTASIVWSPDRPGGWIFHCHLNWHVIANPGVGDEMEPRGERIKHVVFGNPHHAADNHVVEGMGGLMLAMYIRPPEGWQASTTPRRQLRLFVQTDSAPGDSARRFGYILQEGDREPASDSVRLPGSTLVLRKGEPTSVWVLNRTHEPTQVHWHGLEIESYFDGVTGVGGMKAMPTPPIMPGDSFEMRVTPPRAGSFMYHTHVNDIYQQRLGLYGPLLVLDEDEVWDPERDRVFLIGNSDQDGPLLNGTAEHETMRLEADTPYRFRLMNITMGGPNLEVWLVRDGAPVRWTPLAKDGHDLPTWQRNPQLARQAVSIGETYDFRVQARGGDYVLEVRRGNGGLVTRQSIQVAPADSIPR